MTDERIPDLPDALERLPRGSGVVFRHHDTPAAERQLLFRHVRAIARRRRFVLLLAGTPREAIGWGADGTHHRSLLRTTGLRSVAVHDAREAAMAAKVGADLIFISPVFGTRSHPGQCGLGPVRAGILARRAASPAVALGGLSAKRFKRLNGLGFHGWAAIDALSQPSSDQNRNAVPT